MQWNRWMSSLSLAACVMLPIPPTLAAAQSGPYSVVDQWKIGGDGGWDYLLADPSMNVLYVTHGPRVEVLDLATGKPVGAITELKGTHGVALDPDGKYGYISDGGANAVVVFDRKTYQKVNSIPAGTNPDGIVFEPVTKTVWAFNGRSSDATVISTATMKVVATLKLTGKPEFPAADGKGVVFDNIETKGSIARFDARTLKQTAEWPLAGCDSPSGLVMDIQLHHLFSVCDGKKMAVTDSDSGKVLKLVEIGDGPDAAGLDPQRGLAFSSNGQDGTLTVVDTKTSAFPVLQNLPTQKSGRTMAFDPKTGRIFIAVAQFGARPAATAENQRPRPSIVPGSFTILVVARK